MADRGNNLIDGRVVAGTVRQEIATEVAAVKAETGKIPGLAVVLVGERKDSQTYVRMKKKAAEECGFADFSVTLPADCPEEEVLEIVERLNANPEVHGILVQLPLPEGVNEKRVLDAIDLGKDVDGFSPVNVGELFMKGRQPHAVACTPKGCMELLKRHGVKLEGANTVVVGRSNIVGIPMAALLLGENATVTVCHSRTEDMAAHVRNADVVVAAVGQPGVVKGEWIKEGAVVIDVGMNSIEDASRKSGYRLVGDVDFQEASKHARLITPVPGGVGPMTVAMLMSNTLDAFKRLLNS